MFNIFKKKIHGTGAMEDPRLPEEKAKDYRHEEIAAAGAPLTWVEKPQSEWRKFEIFNQDGSSSCVAQSKAKEGGILNFLEEGLFIRLSARDVYAKRQNKPAQGMWGADANNIVVGDGITLESLMPSEGKGEAEMNNDSDRTNSMKVIAKVFRGKSWFVLPFDFDAIGAVIDQGIAVNVWFRWDLNEWDQPVPKISPTSALANHHSVVAVDRTLYQGKKALIIEDSWGKDRGFAGQRVITEDWIGRMTWASYFVDLSNLALLNEAAPTKPHFVFTKDLQVGMTDPEVKGLQDCLKFEGLFPNLQESTGYFGGLTRKAVVDFQNKYADEILKPLGLTAATGIVGASTRQKLNALFGQ
jgi:hypothetical protein